MKHIHLLGICGTFMAGIAALAREQGYRITGCDTNVYPPMSTQLESLGIEIIEGFELQQLQLKPNCYVIGNALMRGNPLVEAILQQNLNYQSGPAWLYNNILKQRWVLAVAGTHGKTTTTSILIWLLECADLNPGYLLGGIPQNFAVSARLGKPPFFVIEADEYDSAFFDKRSKFMHYHPRTLILNNLEFDHADIFRDLADIERQFHHAVRTVPADGLIIHPQQDPALQRVLAQGCWTPQLSVGEGGVWQVQAITPDFREFKVLHQDKEVGQVQWSMLGEHNAHNALVALLAARHAGVPVAVSLEALNSYKGVKRRLEVIGQLRNITVYDDFAHHPTAVQTTLQGLRASVGSARILAILELGSYTMREGMHSNGLVSAMQAADQIFLAQIKRSKVKQQHLESYPIFNNTKNLIEEVVKYAQPNDHILIMSNTGFNGFHQALLTALA